MSEFLTLAMTWGLLGLIFLLVEILLISGTGFLYGGLGALTLALCAMLGLVSPHSHFAMQLAWFLGFSALWTAVLWKYTKHYRHGKKRQSDIIGSTAIVEGTGLEKGQTGKVRWNGVPMNARLMEDSKALKLAHGSQVRVIATKGKLLYVQHSTLPIPDKETLVQYRKKYGID